MPALLELNPQGKCIVQSIHDQMIYELKKKFEECLFETPEDCEKIIGRSASVQRAEVRVGPGGNFIFDVELGVFQMISSTMSSYVGTTSNTTTNTMTSPTSLSVSGSVSSGSSIFYNNNSPQYITTASPQIDQIENLRLSFAADGNLILDCSDKLLLKDGNEITIEMPDGTLIQMQKNGNFTVDDKDSKVVYKGNRIREFNRFINASDLLQDFIRFLGKQGLRQSEALSVPIELFVSWLVLCAAESDGEEKPDDVVPVENHPKFIECKKKVMAGKCLRCGRFISANKTQAGFNFCSIDHAREHCERFSLAS